MIIVMMMILIVIMINIIVIIDVIIIIFILNIPFYSWTLLITVIHSLLHGYDENNLYELKVTLLIYGIYTRFTS